MKNKYFRLDDCFCYYDFFYVMVIDWKNYLCYLNNDFKEIN